MSMSVRRGPVDATGWFTCATMNADNSGGGGEPPLGSETTGPAPTFGLLRPLPPLPPPPLSTRAMRNAASCAAAAAAVAAAAVASGTPVTTARGESTRGGASTTFNGESFCSLCGFAHHARPQPNRMYTQPYRQKECQAEGVVYLQQRGDQAADQTSSGRHLGVWCSKRPPGAVGSCGANTLGDLVFAPITRMPVSSVGLHAHAGYVARVPCVLTAPPALRLFAKKG